MDKEDGKSKKDQKETDDEVDKPEKDHSPEGCGGDGHRKLQEEHLTPLTLFTPRDITAPVFRRPVAST